MKTPRHRLVPKLLAVAGVALLAGCIDSAQPILTGATPLLGQKLRLALYTLRDGAAREPMTQTFAWRGDRYVPLGGKASDIGAFSLHSFEGADLIVQSARPNRPAEYAIARKLADGTYLVVAVDESDADDATRARFCGKDPGAACRVASEDAVLAFARATAAKPHATGGLAVLVADH